MSPSVEPTPDLIQAVLRHKGKVLLWTGLVGVASLCALIFWPRKYESEAKLFLRLGRESVALDPTATTGTTLAVQESRENQLNSARDMLKSRALLERVVEKLGAEHILHGTSSQLDDEMSRDFSILSFSSVSKKEKAITSLTRSMGLSLAKNSSVITISFTAKSPELAQEITQSFLDAYREQHLAANHTAGSLRFFGGQEAQIKKELDVAVSNLRDAKNEMGLISIPVEQQAVQAQLTQIEGALLTTKASLASSEASSASLRRVLEKIPENLTTQQTTGFANVAADQMQQEYFKVLITLNEQQAKLGDNHPLTEITRNQAQKLQKVLDKQAVERKQTTVGVNSSRQSLEIDLRREEALVESLRAKVTTLTNQLATLQGRLKNVNEQEVRISDLERNVTLSDSKYRRYADHLEQARIGEALEDNRISNVNLVQPPTLVEQPVSPKPLTVFGGALVALVAGALGLVFASEYLDRTQHPGSLLLELDHPPQTVVEPDSYATTPTYAGFSGYTGSPVSSTPEPQFAASIPQPR